KRSKRLRAATQVQTSAGGRGKRGAPAAPVRRTAPPQAPKTVRPTPLLLRARTKWRKPARERPQPSGASIAEAPLDRAALPAAGLVTAGARIFFPLTGGPSLPTGGRRC